MRASRSLRWIAPLVATLFVALAPFAAVAQGDAENRVQQLLTESYDDYDMLQLPAAEAKLQSAVELIEMAGVNTPVAAETWVMMGVVRYALTGAEEPVLNAFVQALLIDAAVEINPYYATPTLEEILERARGLVPAQVATGPDPGPGPGPGPGPVGPPPGPPAPVVQHTPVQQAQAGRPIILSATVPVSVPVARVVVNFRPLGAPTFYAVELFAQPDGVSFLGEIPAEATSGPVQVDYYITVLDRAGTVLGTAGTPAQPFGVVVFGGIEDPGDGGGRDRDRDRDRAPSEERDEIFHFTLGGGTGFGLATSEPNVYADEVRINPGMAATPIHMGFEMGFVAARAFHLVPFLRLQLVILESGIEPEPLVGLKARYFFRDDGPLRVYGQGSVGYGDVSHVVYLAEKDTYDTTNEGPVHVGVGLGLLYMFNDTVGLQNDVHAMVLFDRFSFQVDYTLGLYFAF